MIGIDDFLLEAFGVGHALTCTGGLDEPREGEVKLAVTRNRERDLVVRATDTTRLDLEIWRDIRERFFEHGHGIFGADFLGGAFQSLINRALGGLFLAVEHRLID